MRYLIIIFLLFTSGLSFSQAGKVVFNNSVKVNNGIYSTYKEILENSPKYPDCSLRYDNSVFNGIFYEYTDANSVVHDYNDSLFAVSKNGILYICYMHRFNKLLIKGAISIFNKEYPVTYYHLENSLAENPNAYTSSEDHIFIVDLMNGNIKRLNLKNIEEILQRDKSLYDEFSGLSKSKKRKSIYPYILKYNTRNPIFIDSE